MRILKFCLALLLLSAFIFMALGWQVKPQALSQTLQLEALEWVKLTIVYDNYPYVEGLKTAWGFSCLVETPGETILFDTGGNPEILLENLEKLGFKPSEVDLVVLSHIHGDHVGGLRGLLKRGLHPDVYLPKSFPKSFKEELKACGCRVIEVSGPTRICRGVGTTGEMGSAPREQALLINTREGLIMLTGCAHPGVDRMAEKASKLTGRRLYLVLGGFHLAGSSEQRISQIIEGFSRLGVVKVAPCHCSGDLARKMFREAFKENFLEAGVGKTIIIGKPDC